MNRSLPKSSRLYLRNDIRSLFESGSSFTIKPVKCYYRLMGGSDRVECGGDNSEQGGDKLMVSAPKRYLRRAVDRNYMKRRLRESFRVHRESLGLVDGESLHIALMYNRGELMEYDAVEGLVVRVLGELSRRLESLRCR